MQYILAIDQGTTGSRSVIYDKRGTIITSAYQEFSQYFPRPGWVEHDPEEIWHSVYATIQKVLKEVPAKSITAIGITNQRETTVIWERKSGKPVYNAIVWQCRRTAERCNQLKKQKETAKWIKDLTGLPIDAYFSASKAEWIIKNILSPKQKAQDLCLGTIDSWILWKLTGGKVHATDYTNASRTLLLNLEKKQWDNSLLEIFHIPENMLPKPYPSASHFGKTAKIGKLSAGIPITGMAGDQQAALFGQACFTPGSMKNTYGTGCFMLLNTGQKRIHSQHGLLTTLACNQAGESAYALEGSVFIAGAAIQWLRDQLGLLKKSSEAESLACQVKDNGGVYFVPAFVGLGAPYWEANARGIITGLTRGTTKQHLVRAGLEAMCYATKDVLTTMQKEAGIKIKELKVDGGAAVNNFLCQFQADILGINILRPRITETTSLGAAYLAGLAVGYFKDAAEIKKLWRADRTFTPSMGKEERQTLYQGWQNAIKKTLVS